MNNSPWIHQLDKERATNHLSKDEKTDVAVIGAGIAGIATAFFLLKLTSKKVMLIEGDKLAHGATGHNAGQIAGYFEKPFRDIAAEFGLEMACQGQRDLDSAWELLDEMYSESGLDIPLARFKSYAGLSTLAQVLGHLENSRLRRSGGLYAGSVEIAEDAPFLHEIPEKYHRLFSLITQDELSLKLETFDPQYVAVLSSQKGVMNSALFCQEVAAYLLETYRERFSLFEHTHIAKVVLKENPEGKQASYGAGKVLLDAGKHTIECSNVVLCTNGFDNFEIFAPSGLAIDTRFHHNVNGVVAFMSGYLEPFTGIPAALSYFQKSDLGLTDNPGDPYFYVTRRPYEYLPVRTRPAGEERAKHNLISVGGPDFALEEKAKYDRSLEFSETAGKQIADFVRRTYDKSAKLDFAFMWHGVMGYTKNLLRMVGPDPEHKHLFYNLGCNGVGILASIFGGNKVARQIAGENFPSSIFDIPARLPAKSPIMPTGAPGKVRLPV